MAPTWKAYRCSTPSQEAVDKTGAEASFVVVPPKFASEAIMEAAEGGIRFIVCITEGIPAHDEALFYNKLKPRLPGYEAPRAEFPGHHLARKVQHRHHLR